MLAYIICGGRKSPANDTAVSCLFVIQILQLQFILKLLLPLSSYYWHINYTDYDPKLSFGITSISIMVRICYFTALKTTFNILTQWPYVSRIPSDAKKCFTCSQVSYCHDFEFFLTL